MGNHEYKILSEDAIKYLCGLIRDLASVSEGIDNINLADDKTFSNIYIKNLIDKCLEDANAEAEKLVGALTHLTCEETAIQPTLDNSEINVIYLYSADGNPPYQQFLKISEDKLIDLGSTSISLEDYIKAADVAKDYATKVELKAVTDKIGTTTLTTTDTTITGAIEEVKGIADGKADKSEIPTTVSELTDSADYAKTADIPTTLPANGGNADTVNNHTVESDVPTDAVFTDTVYDDTEVKESINEVNESLSVIGKCKNLLNPPLQTTTINGVTCTNNGDGTYTLNGTATNYANFILINEGTAVIRQMIDGKTFKVTGFKETGNYRLECTAWLPTGGTYVFDSRIWNVPNGAKGLRIDIVVLSGATLNDVVVKPMLTTDLNATYDDFVPYTGEGETLTHDIAEIKNNLGGLTFSASGTTLSITDGTNTWTLEANS